MAQKIFAASPRASSRREEFISPGISPASIAGRLRQIVFALLNRYERANHSRFPLANVMGRVRGA